MLPYHVLEQLARDRRQQREEEAQAERLDLPARTPRRRTSPVALVLIAWARRQAARLMRTSLVHDEAACAGVEGLTSQILGRAVAPRPNLDRAPPGS
jgi:hypothetical protein